jgi:hypothetical protein
MAMDFGNGKGNGKIGDGEWETGMQEGRKRQLKGYRISSSLEHVESHRSQNEQSWEVWRGKWKTHTVDLKGSEEP